MELTRHFVATVYVVVDGAVPLHTHERLEMWLPPGGHIERAEAPHETAIRETREETGLSIELLQSGSDVGSNRVRAVPTPAEILVEDINVCGDDVGHQHVDFIYFATADARSIDPDPGEATPERWDWFTAESLADADVLEPDVVALGRRAIELASGSQQ